VPRTDTTADRPLRRDAERNRQRINQAARELFAERGFAVTLDDIADRAEVGIGTVYRRYPDKRALIDLLFEERMAQIVELFDTGLADPDPWRGLVFALESSLALMVEDRGLWELMMSGDHGGDGVQRGRVELGPRMERLVRRAQASGAVRADLEPSDLPLVQMMVGALIDATRDVAPDVWRRHLRLILDGLRPDRRKPSPLPHPALSPDEMDTAMRASHHG
jgi:AcrR family transcriptional regulator